MNQHPEGGDEGPHTDAESEVDPALPPRQPAAQGQGQDLNGISSRRSSENAGQPEPATSKTMSKTQQQQLPRFPKKPDSLLNQVLHKLGRIEVVPFAVFNPLPCFTQDEIEKRQQQLENYLKAILSHELYRNHPHTVSGGTHHPEAKCRHLLLLYLCSWSSST